MAVVRPPTAEEIAEMLGVDAEKIYEVTVRCMPAGACPVLQMHSIMTMHGAESYGVVDTANAHP